MWFMRLKVFLFKIRLKLFEMEIYSLEGDRRRKREILDMGWERIIEIEKEKFKEKRKGEKKVWRCLICFFYWDWLYFGVG